ncbi:MAG: flagellar motor protein MotB [candidate division Zixibacteria bacterium]|nr:flagellar motor protein MotB [Candidatus Tariuqbacter arcticus]
MRHNTDKREKESPDSWLLTYSDMITLMLAFFVILLAVSKIDPIKLEMVSQSMNTAMDKSMKEQVTIEQLVNDVEEFIRKEELEDIMEVNITPRGVAVSAKGKVFFSSGSAGLLSSGLVILEQMKNMILETPYNIAVEGHTDNVPISASLQQYYPSNWELSSARSSSLVRYFIRQGIPAERLRAMGYAETQPVASNDTEEGRVRNRRVTVVFLVF